MGRPGTWRSAELSAVLIAPDRELAAQFCRTLETTRAFQIVAELKKYPTEQTLDIRLRQLRPDAVLIDLASNFETAAGLLRVLAAFRPAVHVIGLHRTNDPDVVLRALQLGASEFFHAPFDPAVQRDAVAGFLRLRRAESQAGAPPGKIVAFSSAKPGSGASVLACQTALALRGATGGRVLLADLDLTGGTVGFYLKTKCAHSLIDAAERCEHLDPAAWAALTTACDGLDVLPAPAVPREANLDNDRLRAVLDQSRHLYDWVLLDLPAIFHSVSLTALVECDSAFLVSTAELPSLHLARKAVTLLAQLGIGKERLNVLVNQLGRGDGMSGSDLEKIFGCAVHSSFPSDYSSLHKVVTLGETLAPDSNLGKAVGEFAGRLAGLARSEKRRAGIVFNSDPAFAGT